MLDLGHGKLLLLLGVPIAVLDAMTRMSSGFTRHTAYVNELFDRDIPCVYCGAMMASSMQFIWLG